jgi:hypothetical protein
MSSIKVQDVVVAEKVRWLQRRGLHPLTECVRVLQANAEQIARAALCARRFVEREQGRGIGV